MEYEQFQQYLHMGLGRTVIYLQDHDASPYRDLILHACLYNPVYDRQSEGDRAHYLYDLIQRTTDPLYYRSHILAALAEPMEGMDVDQLFGLARLFAQSGDVHAHKLMYQRCGKYAQVGDDTGADHLIALDGLDGFLFVAENLGAYALGVADFVDDDHLLLEVEERYGETVVAEHVARIGADNPRVQAYITAVYANRERRAEVAKQRLDVTSLEYDQLRKMITSADKRAWYLPLQRWGVHASTDAIARAAHDLLRETDQQRVQLYLRIFQRRQFPLAPETLAPLAWHENQRIAVPAIQALANIHHPEVRALAFRLLESNQHVGQALDLLVNNYTDADQHVIEAVVMRHLMTDELHGIGLSVIDVYESNPTADDPNILLHLYERGPCSVCRKSIVKQLLTRNALPEWIAKECLFDANMAVRAMISARSRV